MNAFVLAGGRSTRMGRDKALLKLNGHPLIEIMLAKLRAIGLSPRIVGSRPDLSAFAPIIPDIHPGAGPLGGIEAALLASGSRQNLFLPVDLPWISEEFLRWLIERAESTYAMATMPRLQGRPQPLCAVYDKALLPYAQAAIDAKNAKVISTVEHAANASGRRIDSFDVETIFAAQSWEQQPLPLYRWFQNLNTFSDFEKAVLEQSSRIH